MPQQITQGFRALLDAAEKEVETLSVEDARRTLEAAGWFTGREVRL